MRNTTYTYNNKQYELSNHLGNVLVTTSDLRKGTDNNADCIADYYNAIVTTATDYYAFGSLMPARQFNSTEYTWGFNGKEMDNEISGNGNQYDYGFRIYYPRLGKFLSVDPLTKSYPWNSTYAFAENRVIDAIELDGLEILDFRKAIFRMSLGANSLNLVTTIECDNIPELAKSESCGEGGIYFKYKTDAPTTWGEDPPIDAVTFSPKISEGKKIIEPNGAAKDNKEMEGPEVKNPNMLDRTITSLNAVKVIIELTINIYSIFVNSDQIDVNDAKESYYKATNIVESYLDKNINAPIDYEYNMLKVDLVNYILDGTLPSPDAEFANIYGAMIPNYSDQMKAYIEIITQIGDDLMKQNNIPIQDETKNEVYYILKP